MRFSTAARGGNALVIVLGLVLLLAAEMCIVTTQSSGSSRQTMRSRAHLAALRLGDSVFSTTVARILSKPWSERWFLNAAVVETDVPLNEGTYSSFVETVPHPSRKMVELYVKSLADGATVFMVWRVEVVDDSLEMRAQTRVEVFTHMPASTGLPAPGGANPIRAEVDRLIAARASHEPSLDRFVSDLPGLPKLPDVARRLGITLQTPALDRSSPLDGSTPVEHATYLDLVRSGIPSGPPPVSAPSPGPSPGVFPPEATALAAQFPNPQDIQRAFTAALGASGMDPNGPDAARYYDQLDIALKEKEKADQADYTAAFDDSVSRALKVLDELADGADNAEKAGDTATMEACRKALELAKDYLAAVTDAYARSRGVPPPDPATFAPYQDATLQPIEAHYDTLLLGYANWWSQQSGLGQGAAHL
jgi:hypothetical protein